MSEEQRRREECRIEVLRYLALRTPLAFDAPTIRRKLRMDGGEWTDAEVEVAAQFLVGYAPALVEIVPEALGATKRYKVTTAGIIEYERRS